MRTITNYTTRYRLAEILNGVYSITLSNGKTVEVGPAVMRAILARDPHAIVRRVGIRIGEHTADNGDGWAIYRNVSNVVLPLRHKGRLTTRLGAWTTAGHPDKVDRIREALTITGIA